MSKFERRKPESSTRNGRAQDSPLGSSNSFRTIVEDQKQQENVLNQILEQIGSGNSDIDEDALIKTLVDLTEKSKVITDSIEALGQQISTSLDTISKLQKDMGRKHDFGNL